MQNLILQNFYEEFRNNEELCNVTSTDKIIMKHTFLFKKAHINSQGKVRSHV